MQGFVCLEVTILCEENKEYSQHMIGAYLLLEKEFILCVLLCTNTAVSLYSVWNAGEGFEQDELPASGWPVQDLLGG